ncbi:hypothetical protein [Pseudomonas anguilliseptica]|uniref:hypothetical protein n=1 Tax=Pseudomonas anguilliseptica TaxID=53406 RepID=UPI00325C05E1
MLVKIHADDDFIERLKDVTGERTGSKAVAAAYLAYMDQLNMIARLERENGQLRETVRVHQQVIRRARESAAALLDHVAQGDLINVV